MERNGELIGTINLGNVEEVCHMCDTCYMLSPGFWNKGIMTEVLEAVLNMPLIELDLTGFRRSYSMENDKLALAVLLKKWWHGHRRRGQTKIL